ncbi:hypothetical protein R1flu_008045 [Riccia fluitans]|uniref:Uncharacterized protein n=1 Tax=Riccia fluitans TaxID=41844 RepID=A0ABD1YAS1_9MARC
MLASRSKTAGEPQWAGQGPTELRFLCVPLEEGGVRGKNLSNEGKEKGVVHPLCIFEDLDFAPCRKSSSYVYREEEGEDPIVSKFCRIVSSSYSLL